MGSFSQTTTNGGLTSLHSFGGYLDGAQPEASFMQAADVSLYGTTYHGGTNGFGTVLRLVFPPPPVFLSAFQTNRRRGNHAQCVRVAPRRRRHGRNGRSSWYMADGMTNAIGSAGTVEPQAQGKARGGII